MLIYKQFFIILLSNQIKINKLVILLSFIALLIRLHLSLLNAQSSSFPPQIESLRKSLGVADSSQFALHGKDETYFIVNDIIFEGLKRIEKESLQEKLTIHANEKLTKFQLVRSLKNIYASNHFDYIRAYEEKVTTDHNIKKNLVFVLKERPLISEFEFEGLSELKEDDVKGKIQSKRFSLLDRNKLLADLQVIKKMYFEKGYYLAKVNYRIIPLSEKTHQITQDSTTNLTDVDKVKVIIDIDEMTKVKIKNIAFHGNYHISSDEIKAIMLTREDSLLTVFNDSGTFQEEGFNMDLMRIAKYYRIKGYLQAAVANPEISITDDHRWAFVNLRVLEGPRFKVRQITFSGDVIFTESELHDEMRQKSNAWYSEELLDQDMISLTEKYQDLGYAFANANRNFKPVPGENAIDIEINFEKGKIVSIGQVNIVGHTKTRDRVIRRELRIREGDQFSGSGIRRSVENIKRLSFFEPQSVIIRTISPPGRDDIVDLEVSVKETNTGQIQAGMSFSTADRLTLNAQVGERNLLGHGYDLNFSLNRSRLMKEARVRFTEPALMDSRWSLGGSIFYQNRLGDAFLIKERGSDISTGRRLDEDFYTLLLNYSIQNRYLDRVADPALDPRIENGIMSSISTTLDFNDVDHVMTPTKGKNISLTFQYMGIGGDQKWLRTELRARYFKSFFEDFTWRNHFVSGRIFKNGRPIPRSSKYILGGQNDLRGYPILSVSPKREGITGEFFNLGGLLQVHGSTEIEYQLSKNSGIRLAAFLDFGNVFEEWYGRGQNGRTIYANYGFGVRILTPIFPLIRFELAKPLVPLKIGNQILDRPQFIFALNPSF